MTPAQEPSALKVAMAGGGDGRPPTPEEAVKALDIEPGGDTSRRPVHTNGIGGTGSFTPSDVARKFCKAKFFDGASTDVTVRFSNGSGLSQLHDGWTDVRGLAVRFHLPDGGASDLLAMTLSEFFTPTPETFMPFARATNPPQPVGRASAWQKLGDMLRLIKPLEDPPPGQTTSGEPGGIAYADLNPASRLPMFHASTLGKTYSYAREVYHAVHTFVVVAPDGVRRHVRFHWIPVAGVRRIDPWEEPEEARKSNDDYLQDEVRDRLAKGPLEFLLMMVIGEAGDDFKDPSRSWPPHRVRIVMGTLTVRRIATAEENRDHYEKLSFNPCRLVDGIEPSEDPILLLRHEAYEWSRNRRHGIPCPFAKGPGQ